MAFLEVFNADLGGQAMFYCGHKITIFIWPAYVSKGLSTLAV